MNLTFTHAGQTRTLAKHPAIARKLKAGHITASFAATKAWYLRCTVDGREQAFKLVAADREAVRGARDILNGQTQHPAQFSEFLAVKAARHSLTMGQLAAEWTAAGLPFRKTDPRSPEAAARLSATLNRALPWWRDKAVATITPTVLEDFVASRAPRLRSADLELSCLSSLCQWAVLGDRIAANPFDKRPTFNTVKQHCHEACPENDETLHRVLGWLFETNPLVAGTLAFCALTGLRPGEPVALTRQVILDSCPASTRNLAPGAIFRDRSGLLRMKVLRLKNGQNPFVILHPAAESFLCAWRAWMARNHSDTEQLFPLGTPDQTLLNRELNRATAQLELPHYKPHGFGRAYFVRVRRSQGADDATISGELGQTTNGQLIRSVYGDPQDLVGGALFDWLPATGEPSWNLLRQDQIATSVLRLNADRLRHVAPSGDTLNRNLPPSSSQLVSSSTPIKSVI